MRDPNEVYQAHVGHNTFILIRTGLRFVYMTRLRWVIADKGVAYLSHVVHNIWKWSLSGFRWVK